MSSFLRVSASVMSVSVWKHDAHHKASWSLARPIQSFVILAQAMLKRTDCLPPFAARESLSWLVQSNKPPWWANPLTSWGTSTCRLQSCSCKCIPWNFPKLASIKQTSSIHSITSEGYNLQIRWAVLARCCVDRAQGVDWSFEGWLILC